MNDGKYIMMLVMAGTPFNLCSEMLELAYNLSGTQKPLFAIVCGLLGSSLWLSAAILVSLDVITNAKREYAKSRRAR